MKENLRKSVGEQKLLPVQWQTNALHFVILIKIAFLDAGWVLKISITSHQYGFVMVKYFGAIKP